MDKPNIPGGFIILSRKIIESEIWSKPPLYIKVWIYLLTRAQHSTYKGMERGELRTSIPEIIESCKWTVGARVERPTKDQIFRILDWLRKPNEHHHEKNTNTTMITTTKATHGMLVKVDNYAFYQDISNYETNAEHNDESKTNTTRPQRRRDNINKNVKNLKNGKNDLIPYIEIVEYLNQVTKSRYKHSTNKTRSLINARWNEGHRLEDFKMVIDKKSSEWLDDEKMSQYLRPETLFGTKFEGYLNQPLKIIEGGRRDAHRPSTRDRDNIYDVLSL